MKAAASKAHTILFGYYFALFVLNDVFQFQYFNIYLHSEEQTLCSLRCLRTHVLALTYFLLTLISACLTLVTLLQPYYDNENIFGYL